MKRYGYDPKVGLGSIAAAGPLAILIPPSTPMIIYGLLSETSIGKLFMAGWLPGIMLTILLCVCTLVIVKIKPAWAPNAEKTSMAEKIASLKQAWPIAVLVVFIMYCIWGGVTTVNEAAGVAVIGCLIVVLLKRRATGKTTWKILQESAVQAAGLFFMFVGIQLFNSFMGFSRLPLILSQWVTSLELSPMGIIWVIVAMYLILGCFIDTPVIMMLTIPLFAPVVSALGFDLVWFGIVSVMCVAMGSITPPVGICLFVISARVKDVPIAQIIKGVWPYVVVTFAGTVLVMYFPQISLLLPNLMSH
jgi:tripartite ATP-independent transporter DctM subunit